MRTFRRMMTSALLIAVVAALLPSGVTLAGGADITLSTTLRQTGPITAYLVESSELPSLDPQIAEDSVSIDVIENLFLGLTNYDPLNPGGIVPELATSWEINEDSTVWTFSLRTDVPWVRWDPVADEATVIRNVTAADVEYGMKRSCDPRLAAYYSNISKQIIKGCDVVMDTPTEEITPETFAQVGVVALDDATLQVTLQFPAAYFFGQTPMWQYRATPREAIEEFGDNWTEPGNIVTNGPFVIDEWVRGVRRTFYRNPYFPADMLGPGNVERFIFTQVEDAGTIFALYLDNQVEASGVPSAELQRVLNDPAYADQLNQVSTLSVFYFAFVANKAPFDSVPARAAFYASVDRNAFIQDVRQGRGIPMIHFTPPGMFGAPPINEVGVGYDPEFARAKFAEAGYPNCEGFPNIDIVVQSPLGSWAEFLAASVERELGCDPNLMTIEQNEFSVLLETTDPGNPPEDRPNIYELGWGPDYADANNWVNDVLYCEGENRPARECSEVDDLIIEASREPDAERRIELYYRIEEMFFGPEGVFPMIPLFLNAGYTLLKPWYQSPIQTDGLFGGDHWDYRSIDQAAQLAGRGS